MSAALMVVILGLSPPPPPSEDTVLDSLEDGEESQGTPRTPSADASPDTSTDPSPEASSPPPERQTEPEVPGPNPAGEIIYDAHGDPVVPFDDATQREADLPFAHEAVAQEELPYADEAPKPGADLPFADRPPRNIPSRAALERQSTVDLDGGAQAPTESPQRFAVEVKFGPYLPRVDEKIDPSSFGPYTAIFGEVGDFGIAVAEPKRGLYSAISFEWQFAKFGGPLSIGGQVGYFRDKADGLLAVPEDGNLRSQADQVTFTVIPVAVLLGYRFELAADRWKVPLIPYARGGLAYGFWWSRDGSGDVSTNSLGEKGRGGSLGWQANLGVMLQLDFIDRASARSLDRHTGINHTHVFGEYQLLRVDGFGSDERMSVGDDTYMLGLAVEF